MPIRRRKNDKLHGNVPDSSPVALILIDVINDLDFPQNASLLKQMPALTENIAALAKRCRKSRIPVIYVNDNRGKWRSDFSSVIAHCKRPGIPGSPFVEKLDPAARGLRGSEAQALRVLRNAARHPAGLPENQDRHSGRSDHRRLCSPDGRRNLRS